MKRERTIKMPPKDIQKKMDLYLCHRIDCDGLINELVEAGLAYFDSQRKPHWTPEGKKLWQRFYAELPRMHESWQCLTYASLLIDGLAADMFRPELLEESFAAEGKSGPPRK